LIGSAGSMRSLMLAILALALCTTARAQDLATLYVSPQGNDRAAGSRQEPLATLARAVTLSRQIPAGTPRRIELADGEYHEVSVELTPLDEGLTIEAAAGAKPLLMGGRVITGWQKLDNGWWAAPLPEVKTGEWDFRLLVADGEFCPRARWPREGAQKHLSRFNVRWLSTSKGGWERKPTDEELTTLRFKPGDLPATLDAANLELTIYHMWDASLVGVARIDQSAGIIRFSNPAGHPPGAFGWREHPLTFVAWNVKEGMTDPGQWYLDRADGRVVYWPREGQDLATARLVAPTQPWIIRLLGTEKKPLRNVTLRGLGLAVTHTATHSGGFGAMHFHGAINGSYVDDCTLERLHIRATGGQAIKLNEARRVAVRRNDIHDTGAGGILINGNDCRVEDNLIYHVGRTYCAALGIRASGSKNLVAHNHVHHTPYSAITGGGSDNVYENNLIHDAMQELMDGAAIYVFNAKRCVYRGNFAHSLGRRDGHAFYLDEQSEDCVIEGNLAVDAISPLHMHMARNSVIRDNVCLSREGLSVSLANCDGFVLERNVFACAKTLVLSTSYTGAARLAKNVLHSEEGKVELRLHDRLPTLERNATPVPLLPVNDDSVLADPKFIDPADPQQGYAPDSPATARGMATLNVRSAGVRGE
jgi:hypothetical protein